MFDVAIVGAGPAGGAVAALLAEQGVRVLLLEKERFPRYKACGGGVDGTAMRALGEMRIDPGSSWENAATELLVTSGGRFPAIYRFDQPFALMTVRSDFDALIARVAVDRGAEFHDAEQVRSVLDNGASIKVTTNRDAYEASVLVGADGVYSLVARTFGLNRDPILYVLTSAEVGVPEDLQTAWQGRAQIDISIWPLGYGWVFPKRNHLSIGTGVPRNSAKQLSSRFEGFWQGLGLRDSKLLLQRAHMLAFRRGRAPLAMDRVVLIGDAAGLVDPNTGGGIGWALRSARFAASTILSYLGGETGSLVGYTRLIDEEIEPELRAARALRNSIILRFIISRGRATYDERLWRQVIHVIRGEERYREWYANSKLAKGLAWTGFIPL